MAQLTAEERHTIQTLLYMNFTQTDIATAINRNKSVICRELKRNTADGAKYNYKKAQTLCEARHTNKPKNRRLNAPQIALIEKYILLDYSPEQIVGIIQQTAPHHEIVSHETIYKYIWTDKRTGGKLYTHLRSNGKRYRKRGSQKDNRGIIKNRVSIEHRPPIVEAKTRFGDLEIDTIIGKNHKGAILTINDRKTNFCWLHILKSKEATETEKKVIKLLKPYKKQIHTITADNGKEFANHRNIAKALNIKFYFARPYHSWERGANENMNKLIRQYLPKRADFQNITQKQVHAIQNILNNRPRKRLNFLSPNQIFNNILAKSEKLHL